MQIAIDVFEDRQKAQRAVDRLREAGFNPDDVHLHEGAAMANTATSKSPADPAADDLHRGVLPSIGRFFAITVGEDPPSGYADRYSEAIRRGHPVVVVEARDQSRAEKADAIMQDLGAFDIDEWFEQWKGIGLQRASNNGNHSARRKEAVPSGRKSSSDN